MTILGLRAIADQFDHVLLDQWGTLHAGKAIFPAARECVTKLREAGKRALALSNSGKRAFENERRLAALGLLPDAYDGILTSGEVAWNGLRMRTSDPFIGLGRACFLVSRGGDRSIVEGLKLDLVADVCDADFILLSGLDDEAAEPERWREHLTLAAVHNIPMLCANPDLVMFGARGMMPAPGALAAFYRSLGGKVTFVGKPHPAIFTTALGRLGHPHPQRVLVVGDSIAHDIAGGRAAGMLTLLIRSGVHREDLMSAYGDLQLDDLRQAVRASPGAECPIPHWTMEQLMW
jgi:HAD superfamily hydrolase (TIGR01459 family)